MAFSCIYISFSSKYFSLITYAAFVVYCSNIFWVIFEYFTVLFVFIYLTRDSSTHYVFMWVLWMKINTKYYFPYLSLRSSSYENKLQKSHTNSLYVNWTLIVKVDNCNPYSNMMKAPILFSSLLHSIVADFEVMLSWRQ